MIERGDVDYLFLFTAFISWKDITFIKDFEKYLWLKLWRPILFLFTCIRSWSGGFAKFLCPQEDPWFQFRLTFKIVWHQFWNMSRWWVAAETRCFQGAAPIQISKLSESWYLRLLRYFFCKISSFTQLYLVEASVRCSTSLVKVSIILDYYF